MEAVNSGNEIPCCFQVLMKIFFPWVSVKLKPCYFATNLFSKMEKGTCRNKAFVIKMVFCPIVYFQLHFKKKKKGPFSRIWGEGVNNTSEISSVESTSWSTLALTFVCIKVNC